MNRAEYYSRRKDNEYHKNLRQQLIQWQIDNNCINDNYIIHHRDDTEETRKYNEEHYELWGHNLDGTFEYGKYVVFMTRSEHRSHHNMGDQNPSRMYPYAQDRRTECSIRTKGSNNPMYGKKHTEATREKISACKRGKKLTEEHKAKISAGNRTHAVKILFDVYKNNNGILKWHAFEHAIKVGDITFEVQPITIYT